MPGSWIVKLECCGYERTTVMLAEYKTKTNVFILLGIVTQILGGIVGGEVGGIIRIVGAGLFITGCCFYAKGKGYNGAWGGLGLLSLLGLLILVLMKDKQKELVKGIPERTVLQCPYCSGRMGLDGVLRHGQKVQCPHCHKHCVVQ